MSIYDFAKQLKRGKRSERYLDTLFAADFHIEEATPAQERKGIDRIFTSLKDGRRYTVQYKADKTAARTGNAFIETVSVDNKNIDGWAITCQADFIMYYIDSSGPVYVLRPKDIRRSLKSWRRKYQQRTIPNKGYNTIGLLVPLDVIERLAVRVVNT